MDKELEELINETILYWRGKENNPLNGKTFMEIGLLAKEYGPELKGYVS